MHENGAARDEQDTSGLGIECNEVGAENGHEINMTSVQSSYSNHSRENLAKEIMDELETVHSLIKDDEWFNIPAPIRDTCNGIILFTEKLADKILKGAENNHSKIVLMDEKIKRDAGLVKSRIDRLDSTIQRELRKVTSNMENFTRDQRSVV